MAGSLVRVSGGDANLVIGVQNEHDASVVGNTSVYTYTTSAAYGYLQETSVGKYHLETRLSVTTVITCCRLSTNVGSA